MYVFIAAIAVAFVTQQFLWISSMRFNTAVEVTPLMYFSIPIGYVLDILIFGVEIQTLEVIGACVIFFSNIICGVF